MILIGLRDFQDSKADVLHRYSPEEARELRKEKAIPESFLAAEMPAGEPEAGAAPAAAAAAAEPDAGFEFAEFGDEDIDDL